MRTLALLASIALMPIAALAQVTVSSPWVRATVPGQMATGAFMTLHSSEDAKLIEARSPVAGVVQIHEMKMEGGTMTMAAIPSLPLRAGQDVALKPGSFHVMLMDLKKPIREGDDVPITLIVETAKHARKAVEVHARAKSAATPSDNEH